MSPSIRRFMWLLIAGGALAALPRPGDTGSAAQTNDDAGPKVASLKDQLEKGLRARRPVEFQFVHQVAALVESGHLSRELVVGTFNYTRSRYGKRVYLVPYFEQILRQRAAKEKITLLDNIPTTLPKKESSSS